MQKKTNLKLRWGLLCRGASVDRESNNLTLFNILEQLNIRKEAFADLPKNKHLTVPFGYQLVLAWVRENPDSDLPVRVLIEWKNPSGDTINKSEHNFQFPKGKFGTRGIITMPSLSVQGPGIYNYVIRASTAKSKGFDVFGVVPLRITIRE